MKKVLTILAFTAIMIISALSVNANENEKQSQPADYQITTQNIIVNQEKLTEFPLTINNCTLVPARSVCDSLGFKIKWNKDNNSATINSNTMEMTVYLGEDLYSAHSVIAIGTTTPTPLGSAPILINDKLYVPAEIFRIIQGNDPNAVQITDTQVSINKINTNQK